MLSNVLKATSRLGCNLPRLARLLRNRAALRPVPQPRIPPLIGPQRVTIATPNEFLKAIGRSSETKLAADTWEALWKTNGHDMKKAGISVEDRRYILWCMEKYRLGWDVGEFAHEARPRKKIRGRGPKAQAV